MWTLPNNGLFAWSGVIVTHSRLIFVHNWRFKIVLARRPPKELEMVQSAPGLGAAGNAAPVVALATNAAHPAAPISGWRF